MNEVNRNPYYDFVGTVSKEDTAIIMEDIANKIEQLKILFPECMDNYAARSAAFGVLDCAASTINCMAKVIKK